MNDLMTVGIGFIMAFPFIKVGLCLLPSFHMSVEFEHLGFPYCFQVVYPPAIRAKSGILQKNPTAIPKSYWEPGS